MSLCRSPALTLRQRRLRGAGDKGQAESTRTRLLQECIVETEIAQEAAAKAVIVEIEPEYRRGISVSTPPLTTPFDIALTPAGTIYALTSTDGGSGIAIDFSIHSYTRDGILLNTTPNTITMPSTNGYRMIWDEYSSSIFVAVADIPQLWIYKFSSDLQTIVGLVFIIGPGKYMSFVSNQKGQLFVYMNTSGLWGYDTNLALIHFPTAVPPTTIVNIGESTYDSTGNVYFPITYSPTGNDQNPTNYLSVVKYDASANMLWDVSFNFIEQQDDDVSTPSSLRILNNQLFFLYPSGYNLIIQNISFSGLVVSSATVNLSPYNPPSNLNSIINLSVTINATGRIFAACEIFTKSPASLQSYIFEINNVGTILFSQPFATQGLYYLCTQANTQYLWFFTSSGVLKQYLLEKSVFPSNCSTCPNIAQPTVQIPTVPNQLSHILDVAVNCPLLFVTPTATYGCQPVYTEPIAPLQGVGVEKPQGPAVTSVYRKFQRIGGIDQISKPLVGRAGSDRTARLRAGIISQSQTRYVQTVLPLIPYPPCLPPPPQPGVPIAPNSGCNPGTRRVDYSNPRA